MPRLFSSPLAGRGYQSLVHTPSAFGVLLQASYVKPPWRPWGFSLALGAWSTHAEQSRWAWKLILWEQPLNSNWWKLVNKYPLASHTLGEATLEVWSLCSSWSAQGDELQLPRTLTHLLIHSSTWLPVSPPWPSTSDWRDPLLNKLVAQILV